MASVGSELNGDDRRRRPAAAICVATFRRPDGMLRLIESIDAQILRQQIDLQLIIVDNDAENPIGAPTSKRFRVTYVVEKQRGIPAARNAALDAMDPNCDFAIFIDDDERAEPNWLQSLLDVMWHTDAAAAQGAVRPVFEVEPPRWIRDCGVFELGPYTTGSRLTFAATNNSIVRRAWIDRLGLRFDMDFLVSGGSDDEFYARLQRGGGVIVAAGEAVVADDIPAHRMTLSWLLRRQFRKGNTRARIAIKHRHGNTARIGRALGKIAKGVAMTLGQLAVVRHPGPGLLECAYGVGSLATYVGFGYDEYAEKSLIADRASAAGQTPGDSSTRIRRG